MDTRKHDLEELRSAYNSASKEERIRIEETARKIRNEDAKIKSMREALIKEHRAGNTQNIKDIHEYIKNKQGYK